MFYDFITDNIHGWILIAYDMLNTAHAKTIDQGSFFGHELHETTAYDIDCADYDFLDRKHHITSL